MIDTAIFVLLLLSVFGCIATYVHDPKEFKHKIDVAWKSLLFYVVIPFVMIWIVFNATCNWLDRVNEETKEKVRAEKAEEWRRFLESRENKQ